MEEKEESHETDEFLLRLDEEIMDEEPEYYSSDEDYGEDYESQESYGEYDYQDNLENFPSTSSSTNLFHHRKERWLRKEVLLRTCLFASFFFSLGMVVMLLILKSRPSIVCSHCQCPDRNGSNTKSSKYFNGKNNDSLEPREDNQIISREEDFFNFTIQTCTPDERPDFFCFDQPNFSKDMVCSGHGTCVSNDRCDCDEHFTGNECQYCQVQYYGKNCEYDRIIFHPSFDDPSNSELRKRIIKIFLPEIINEETHRNNSSDDENVIVNAEKERKYAKDQSSLVFVSLLDNVAKYHLEYGKYLTEVYDTVKSRLSTNYKSKNDLSLVLLFFRKEQKFKKFPGEKCLCFGDCQSVETIQQLLNRVTFQEEEDEDSNTTSQQEKQNFRDDEEEKREKKQESEGESVQQQHENRKCVIKRALRLYYDKESFEFTECEKNEITLSQIEELIHD